MNKCTQVINALCAFAYVSISMWDSTIHYETDEESQNMEFEFGLSDADRSERLIIIVEFFLRKDKVYLSSSFSMNQQGIIDGPEGLVNRNFLAMFRVI